MPEIKLPAACMAVVITLFIASCSDQEPEKEKPLVFEGMSSEQLRNNLGEPLLIDSSGHIFSTEYNKRLNVEKWQYEKRTVLLINDTVKDSNLN